MPSERSIFRKIQVILDYCQPRKHHSIDELKDVIEKKSPLNFVYYRVDTNSDETKPYASNKSISHAVDLCVELGLINSVTGHPTKLGVSASDPRRFSRIIGHQTLEILKLKGISLDEIEATIVQRLLHRTPPVSPSVKRIWAELSTEIKLKYFASYMNILGLSGILSVEQKRIYLPIK